MDIGTFIKGSYMKRIRQIIIGLMIVTSILAIDNHTPHIHSKTATDKIVIMIKENKKKEG